MIFDASGYGTFRAERGNMSSANYVVTLFWLQKPEIEWIEPVQLSRILYDLQNLRRFLSKVVHQPDFHFIVGKSREPNNRCLQNYYVSIYLIPLDRHHASCELQFSQRLS